LQRRSGRIHVTTSRGRRGQKGIQLHRVRLLHHDDVTEIDGIPVTTIARTLFDIAETRSLYRLELALERAERLNRLDLTAIHATCERNPGRRGLKPLLSLIAEYRGAPDARSKLERRFVDFCREHGIPDPPLNTIVEGFEVDAVWHEQKLVAELDSWSFHRGRTAFERDRERDIALQLVRYRPIRITDRRMRTAPAALAREILGLLASPATR
jgi:hypothetical protein